MAETFTNNASTTLAGAGLGASSPGVSQTFDVLSVVGFPTTGTFRAVCAGEILTVTAVNAGATPPKFTALRGQEGTAASAKPAGTTITEVLTAGALAALANDILVRVGVSPPLQVSYPAGNPLIVLPPSSGSADGYMTIAQATKLAAIAAGAQTNVLEGITATAPLVAGVVTAKVQNLVLNPASPSGPGSMSAAHYNDLVNAAFGGTPNTLAKRDGNGDLSSRYMFATYFNSATDEARGDQPVRLIGTLGDGYHRTWIPGYVTVGGANYATSAGSATSAGTANALARGQADGNKLDSINQSYGVDANGWNVSFLPNGRRVFTWLIRQACQALVEQLLATATAPAGFNFGQVAIQANVVMGNAGSVNIGLRFGASPGHGDYTAGPTTLQVVAQSVNGSTNLNAYSTWATVYLVAYQL